MPVKTSKKNGPKTDMTAGTGKSAAKAGPAAGTTKSGAKSGSAAKITKSAAGTGQSNVTTAAGVSAAEPAPAATEVQNPLPAEKPSPAASEKTVAKTGGSGDGRLRILIVSPEVNPYSKSGGLGDVAGSLPKALRERGVDARVVLPRYYGVNKDNLRGLKYIDSFLIHLSWRKQSASVYSFDGEGGVPVYLIENDYYFGRDGMYGYNDDYERFAFFSKAAVEFLSMADFRPDVIHFNDWQTGLGPVYLRDVYKGFTFYKDMKSLFTIHNLRYQGVFGREILWSVDLNDGYFTNGALEFYGKVSYMKGGIAYSDAVSTVSETYAREISGGLFDYGMAGLLRSRGDRMFGITNGIDAAKNDPAADPRIFERFSAEAPEGKKVNKARLQEQLGLPARDVPMIAIISRLVDQKGLDLVAVAMDELIGKDVQLAVLGTGDGRYENLFRHYAWRAPDKVSANIFFSDELAQRLYAASDMFLMPSLFEPCGLGQLFAMRYGSVPIVRMTGGLADTVANYDPATGRGTGFVFRDYDARGMMWAVNEALKLYGDRDEWARLVKNCMESDFSWDKSAERYIELYGKMKGM
ncbi:MAG: glycogen synthase [Firmicutes bacterium]|nr:glycogen synthase [Bacillota bacterium]